LFVWFSSGVRVLGKNKYIDKTRVVLVILALLDAHAPVCSCAVSSLLMLLLCLLSFSFLPRCFVPLLPVFGAKDAASLSEFQQELIASLRLDSIRCIFAKI
jgi:hypothetical protein